VLDKLPQLNCSMYPLGLPPFSPPIPATPSLVVSNDTRRSILRPDRQQGGPVPWWNVEEEAEFEEFDEPYLNRGRFERGYGNREARMSRPRRNNDLGNIKIKIPSFQDKNDS
jgi:hypothetical protein